MDLFSIQCTTCKARLVVRDESVIGDILGCPKCGSMVQVVPPPDWKPAGSSTSLRAIAAKNTSGTPPATASANTKKAAAAVPPALPLRKPAPEATASQPAITKPEIITPAQVPAAATPELSASVVASVEPSRWASLVARARKDWLILAGGLATGVALGATAWLVVWMQSPSPTIVAAAPRATDPAPPTKAPAIETTLAKPSEVPTAAVDAQAPPAASPEPAQSPAVAEAAPVSEAPPSEPPVAQPTPHEASPEVATPSSKPSGSLKLEPIAPTKPAVTGGATSVEPAPTESAASTADAVVEPSTSQPADDAPSDEAVQRGSPGDPAPLSVAEVEARLGITLAKVDFSGVTLAQLAAFIGDVSGVQVILDDASLQAAGKTRKSTVTVQLTRTTALAALQAASKQAGLTYQIEAGRIVISAGSR